jgi:uncharacterized DUF497 family protein
MWLAYEWDPNKADANWLRHRVAFERVADFDWRTAWEWRDSRQPYPEVRTIALGKIGDILHALIFTRRGTRIRVIGLRRASQRERNGYVRHNERTAHSA